MKRFLALALILFPSVAFADINISSGSKYVGVRGVAWGASFNVTYILTPVSPEVGVCFYVVNNNPTNAHPFTAQVFQTSDGGVLDFTNNQGKYSSITITGLPASVPALSVGAGFSGTTAAAQIAFKFTASGALGGSPDTADLFFVQTTSPSCGAAGAGILSVQGAIADGTAFGSTNPLVIGGKTSANSSSPLVAKTLTALGENANDIAGGGVYNVVGLAIGAGGLNQLGSFTALTLPNNGPMASALFAVKADTSSPPSQYLVQSANGGVPGQLTGRSLGGLLVNENGASVLTSPAAVNSNGSQIVTVNGFYSGTFDSCFVTVTTGTPTGTTPTLDVYFQTSTDGTNWTDRIHFTQITGTVATQKQFAGIAGASTGITPTTMTDKTLAAGTKIDGPIGSSIQFTWVIGGTTPSFPSTVFGANCH